jgi:hypothetical protein
LVDHLINEDSIPNKYIVPDSTTTIDSSPRLTEEYIVWRKADRLLRGWLIGTLLEHTLGLAVGLDTAFAVWSALKNEYAEDSQEREFTLRQQVTYFRKEDDRTFGEHIRIFKGLCDDLAAIGKPISDKEKIFCLLTSLGPQYETFTTTMLKPPRPSYPELVSQLQSLDQRRNWFTNQTNNSFTPQLAFYGQKHQRPQHHFSGNHVSRQSFISTGRGFHAQQPKDKTHTYTARPTSDSKQKRPPLSGEHHMTLAERELYQEETCQYCGVPGHIAKICWWVPKRSNQHGDLPQALAALTLDNTITEMEWISNTGASNHMTGNPGMLKNIHNHYGSDSVLIDDGSSISMHGIRDSSITQKNKILPLNDVLLVPDLKKNLLSVSQLTSQFPVNCEFSDVDFCIKERQTGQPVITGWRKGDLYALSTMPELYFSNRFRSGPADIWHQRLGHLHFSTLQLLHNKSLIDVKGTTKYEHVCDSCQFGKLSRLPFFRSEHSSSGIFEKIHCDLWGPAPVLSIGKFIYYACLVDDFSKYTWIIPLLHKSDFVDAYFAFEHYVT